MTIEDLKVLQNLEIIKFKKDFVNSLWWDKPTINKNIMEKNNKKIIGYTCPTNLYEDKIKKGDLLIKDSYGNYFLSSTSHVLPKEIVETWEPVYEEEFKVGDWVVVLPNDPCYSNLKGGAQKIIEINDFPSLPYTLSFKNGNRNSYSLIRKATKKEIEEALTTVVNMGSFELVIKRNKVYHRGEDITDFVIELVERFKKCYIFPKITRYYGKQGYSATIQDITFSKTGCEENITKYSDWVKVYNIVKTQGFSWTVQE